MTALTIAPATPQICDHCHGPAPDGVDVPYEGFLCEPCAEAHDAAHLEYIDQHW